MKSSSVSSISPCGNWPQGEDFHPTSQGLGDPGQHQDVGGAGEQEAPRALIAVDRQLDRGEERRNLLDLVDHRQPIAAG